MNKAALALLITLILTGNAITVALLLSERPQTPRAASVGDANALASVFEAIAELRQDVDRLSDLRSAPAATAVSPGTDAADGPLPPRAVGSAPQRLDEVLMRLADIEKTLTAMKDQDKELALARIRAEQQEKFRAEDGFKTAEELLAQKEYAVGANGILTFLEEHPDHPDARDLMQKAARAFLQGGYGEKALWLQGEMMEKFPDPTGQDLYSLSMMEKQLRNYDDALRHINEAVDLAPSEQHRLNRMFYRAFVIHERDGDAAGLEAYREVERLARAAGRKYPRDVAAERASEIEGRLAAR